MHPEPNQVTAIPLFSGLTPEQVEAVCRWSEIRSVDAGTQLITEGAPGYFFFVLQEGAAAVARDGVELGSLGPGDFFGEIAILGGGRRMASVTTTAPSTLLVMFGTEFRQLEQALPEAAEQIRSAMSARLAPAG